MDKRFYVYTLARPDGTVFYIGKGTRRRIYKHEEEARRGHQCHKCHVIRKIWREGGLIQKYFLLETDDEQEAFAYEIELIALYGRGTLCNKTDGGEGARGHTMSEETKAKISRANKAQSHKFMPALAALHRDPAHKQRSAEIIKRHQTNPKRLANLRATLATPPQQSRLRIAVEKLRADPSIQARRLANQQIAVQRPEYKEGMRATLTEKWNDPEYRDKVMASRSTPEVKAKMSEAMHRRNAMRLQVSESRRAEMRRLRHEEELSITEIAARMDVHFTTVYRALKK